jgi:mannose-1-phosphate guanylyltransferase / mannose-6-phosphate isomerase
MASAVPLILSGGSGTRLWPLSRAMYPKQFINFFNGEGASFLEMTLRRLSSGAEFTAPIILCNNDHRFLVRHQLDRIGLTPKAIILEPVARNTAAAVAIGALAASLEESEAVIIVAPSDHLVRDEASFTQQLRRAVDIAAGGKLVLFGIKPTEAHTGYGYIRSGEAAGADSAGALKVAAFFEKPDADTAARYLREGNYFWNSGIFVLHAATFLKELKRYEPTVFAAAREAHARAEEDLGFLRLDKSAFAKAPSISIDCAVMERTDAAVMLPIDVGWNDVGSWASLWDVATRDANENYVNGHSSLHDSSGCYVHSENALVATIGVKDLVIVSTADALLVADRTQTQDVAKIVAALQKSNRKEAQQHVRSHRPWGYFETLSLGPRFQVKLLHVEPGQTLSLQMHHHRSEHWIVVQGTATVEIDGAEKLVRENESVYIVATQWHRLTNPGKVPLQLIEVQTGTYFGEDDIIRSDDVYRRAPDETR